MNPRDYKTWTTFADHPIFSEDKHAVAEWSSDPAVYGDLEYYSFFDPEWYVHQDPKLPTDVQAACATRDIHNLAATCSALEQEFGQLTHELFILDDLTVYVRITVGSLCLDISPHDYGGVGQVLTLYVETPVEAELVVDSVSHVVPKLVSLMGNA